MRGDIMAREHTVSSGNIFLDLGRSPEEAANLKIRAGLMMKITGYIRENELTQAKAAEILGVTQPRVSNLIKGKIGLFSIDMLVKMAGSAGMAVSLNVIEAIEDERDGEELAEARAEGRRRYTLEEVKKELGLV